MWKTAPSGDQYYKQFPVREAEIVQLSRGSSELKSCVVWGRNLVLIGLRSEPQSIMKWFHGPKWMAFFLPLSWEGTYRINGWEAAPDDLFLLNGARDVRSLSARRDGRMICVDVGVLGQACAAIRGVPVEEINLSDRRINLKGLPRHRLHLIYDRMMRYGQRAEQNGWDLTLPAPVERDIVSDLAEWLMHDGSADAPSWLDRGDALRIVRMAEEAIHLHGAKPLSIADLCQATGVQKTKLHQCFVDILDVSPARFLYQSRIYSARDQLLDFANPPVSVKDVALQLGFDNIGRFSGNYRNLFGELPSETLKRTLEQLARGA